MLIVLTNLRLTIYLVPLHYHHPMEVRVMAVEICREEDLLRMISSIQMLLKVHLKLIIPITRIQVLQWQLQPQLIMDI